jgi:ATP-dependent exoDNAse (exonuclease V) beta subunit
MTARPPPPDQEQRDRAIAARGVNVLVDAGAGTGKTTLLVSRLVGMVAPLDGSEAVPIGRVAAITFTRKAAGELRLRIRERLLSRLAAARIGSAEERHLREALAGLDTAYVGTIHSFCDRLLRRHPVQAGLSPSYTIAEDEDPLLAETWELLLGAAQEGTLRGELAGRPEESQADEAAETILMALSTGLRAETRIGVWQPRRGIDALVSGMLLMRDLPPESAPAAAPDLAALRASIGEFLDVAEGAGGDSDGARFIAHAARLLRRLREIDDPLVLRRELFWLTYDEPDVLARDTEPAAWRAWKAYQRDLRQRLLAPLDRWMAARLVRLFPVAAALYEKVKRRRQKLDPLDLLLGLRDLLRDDREVRGRCQAEFQHIFVDEFQDTDPLQAEIVVFLCERTPRAMRWQDVELLPGKLTLVGDPKQSIYRFRRADIAMYEEVFALVRRGGALEVRLSASFRSVPRLIGWLNDRFERVLGRSPEGAPFDATSGSVFHQPLLATRRRDAGPAVHVVPLRPPAGEKPRDEPLRRLEARALARYLRWLCEKSGVTIEDPADGAARPVRFGDVAVLTLATPTLALLFPELDREGIPYASRGGRLFLADPVIRRLLLGLRAVSDPADGVAEAVLLAPPFFALTPLDLLRERGARREGVEPTDEGARRVRRARAWLSDLRARRHVQPPGATARDLLEETALARVLAEGRNGAQRLSRARELCSILELRARSEGLDYDGATALLRQWAEDPVEMDPPQPVDEQAIQILTVHQAKGLEFPVVVMWDGRAKWGRQPDRPAWRMARDRSAPGGWMVDIDGLDWEEPEGGNLRERESEYQEAERRRLLYVAATRARDLLVLPRAEPLRDAHLLRDLLEGAADGLVRELPAFDEHAEPEWAARLAPRAAAPHFDADVLEREATAGWAAAVKEARRPRFRPAGVTTLAQEQAGEDAAPKKSREGRLGPLFGEAVHRAIGLCLSGMSIRDATERAAARAGLGGHRDEVAADAERALLALRAEGLLGPDVTVRLEYPLAGAEEGTLLSGFADLVAADGERLVVIDFKTDVPPERSVENVFPEYAAQVRAYARLLVAGGAAGASPRLGLLFTADGGIRWIDASRSGMPAPAAPSKAP